MSSTNTNKPQKPVKERYIAVNLSMPQSLVERLQNLSADHDRSRSAIARYAFNLYFAYLDQNQNARVHIHERVKVSNVDVELV